MRNLIALLFLLLFAPPAQQEYPYLGGATCDAVAITYGGEVLPWVTDDVYGNWPSPPDDALYDRIYRPDGGEIWIYRAKSDPGHERIWHFFSMEITNGPDGQHRGYHDVCAVTRSVHPYRLALDNISQLARDLWYQIRITWILRH